jgi:Flp pilus assembly protein TadG
MEERKVRAERRSRAADESGQVLILAALGMTMMLVMVALVVDIGKAYLVQRQLQAGVDAGALAGAQFLPDPAEAEQAAKDYGPSSGSPNAANVEGPVTTTVTMRCVASAPGCSPTQNSWNGLRVRATSDVPTVFARILGIDKLTVRASATACSPCSSKPLDIMLVLDRTGSMCQYSNGADDPNCTDLKNAKGGIDTFLNLMDPKLDKVGLALFPPALDRSWVARCPYKPWSGNPSGPTPDGRYYAYDAWWPEWDTADARGQTPSVYAVASLDFDYTALRQRLGCADGAGTTHYASAIEEAQHELNAHGRGNVQDVIVFLSDGAANTSNTQLPTRHWRNNPTWISRPCGSGVQAAALSKGAGTIIYTIGYDLNGAGTDYEKCRRPDANGHQNGGNPVEATQSWGSTAYDAIQAMATDPDGAGPLPPNFFNKATPGDLSKIYGRIAADLARPAARLIDDDAP